MPNRTKFSWISGCLVFSSLAGALPPGEYSCESVTLLNGKIAGTIQIYVSGPLRRIEADGSITIHRPDLGLVWTLQPGSQTYLQRGWRPSEPDPASGPRQILKSQVIRQELRSGYFCTVLRVSVRDLRGEIFESLIWQADELGFAIRSETVQRDKLLVEEKRKIKVEPQPACLFEIPAGYRRSPAEAGR